MTIQQVADNLKIEGKLRLVEGRLFRVTNERGTFRFVEMAVGDVGEPFINAWSRDGVARSFDPSRVRKVYRAQAANKQQHRAEFRT